MLHKKYKLALNLGERHSKSQLRQARAKRSPKNGDEDTVEDVIRILNREHRNEKPSDVWPHLKTSLERWSDGKVTEIDGKGDMRSYRYALPNAESEDDVRPISYGQFRKLLSKIRGGKNGI